MAKITWLLCLCILMSTLQNARAQTYSLKAEPSADALTITFPKKAPPPQVLRTGPRQVELLFPVGTTLAPIPAALGKGRHIMGLGVADNVLVVQVAEEAFGFISSPKGDKALSFQVYYDPAGARWQPSGPQAEDKKKGADAPVPAGPAQENAPVPPTPKSVVRASIAPGGSDVSTPAPNQPVPPAKTEPGKPAAPAQSQPVQVPPDALTQSGLRRPVAPVTPAQSPQVKLDVPLPAVSQSVGVPPGGALPAQEPLKPASSIRASLDAPSTVPAAQSGSVKPVATIQPGPATPEAEKPATSAQSGVTPPATAKAGGGKSVAPGQLAPGKAASGKTTVPAQEVGKSAQGKPGALVQETGKPGSPVQPATSVPSTPAPAGPGAPGAVTPSGAQSGQPASGQGASGGSPPAQAPAKPPRGASEVRGSIFEPITEVQKSQAVPPGELSPPAGPAVSGTIGLPVASQPAGKPDQSQAASGEKPGVPAETPAEAPAEAKPEEKKGPSMVGADTLEDTALFISGQRNQENGQYEKALTTYNTLLEKTDISQEMREELLYRKAEVIFDLYRDTLPEHFAEVNGGLQQALNFNTKSMRIPRALIYLGYLNLRMGNLPEAKAYFNLLKNKYPMDESVPLVDVYWGQYYLDQAKERDPQGNYGHAAEAFKSVLQNSPESKWAKEAALGLAKCLLELKQYSESGKIIEYIDKRWPRYYVDNPTMRRISGDIAFKLGEFQRAKDEYLWFYNLMPNDQGTDMVLSRLGDVNARLGKMDAAREYYDMTIRLHPGTDGALISMMRLAEQGVFDTPTMQEMTKAFASPKDVKPDQIYQHIVNDYPNSAMAPLAQLKLAMWQLYKKDYLDSLESVGRLMSRYPGNDVEKQAIEVAGQAFAKLMPTLMADLNYKRIFELWRAYPFLAANPDLLPHKERLGVALALYYAGFPREALTMAEPYLSQGANDNSQKALALCLTILRENQDWQGILSLLKQVADWKLGDNPRRTLEFAQAMALEHTGDFAKSRLLWARLVNDPQLEPAKKSYALYYQARTALERQDYEKALAWAMDARMLFEETAKDAGKVQDATMLIIEANQKLGRFPQALGWCDVYAKSLEERSPEWAANRFRMATIHKQSGSIDAWRSIMENLRDTMGDSLYGKMASAELNARALEERAGKLTGPM